MDKYVVYLHNVPKVTDDGKPVPIQPNQTQEFPQLDEAQKLAAGNKDKFDRVVVMGLEGDKQKMVERYMDGEHIVPEEGEAAAPEGEAAAPEGETATPEGETATPEGETAVAEGEAG